MANAASSSVTASWPLSAIQLKTCMILNDRGRFAGLSELSFQKIFANDIVFECHRPSLNAVKSYQKRIGYQSNILVALIHLDLFSSTTALISWKTTSLATIFMSSECNAWIDLLPSTMTAPVSSVTGLPSAEQSTPSASTKAPAWKKGEKRCWGWNKILTRSKWLHKHRGLK